MKKLILMLALTALVLWVPPVMARDANRDSLWQIWNAQQKEQRATEKKATAEQDEKDVTVKVYKHGSDAVKTK